MKVRITAVLMLAFAGSTGAQAQTAPRLTFELQSESRVWVEGTSTVRSYRCEAEVITGGVVGSGASLAAERVAHEVGSGSLAIAVDRLECGNGTMNAHMKKALKLDGNPTIQFAMKQVAVSGSTASVSGNLTIAGETRAVTLSGELSQEADGGLRLRGVHELLMTEYGVAPPRLMAGTLRVHDPVRIGFEVVFR
jgi:polyisoprenoid-binding protein YceI